MGIWFDCIKWLHKPKEKRQSPFSNQNVQKYIYTYSNIYLGAKAKVYLCDRKTEVIFSFSVKDGVLVKIKSKQPYRILFDYVDGSYYINDNSNINYNELLESLSTIKQDTSINNYQEIYAKLEESVYDFITKSF